MKQQNYISLFLKILYYDIVPVAVKQRIRNKRLKKLVEYAHENSNFYKKKYMHVSTDLFKLEDLPIVDKGEITANFDEVLTVQDVQLPEVNAFLSNPDNNTKLFKDKYAVAMTSGSTGKQAVLIMDKTFQKMSTVLLHMRTVHFLFPLADMSLARNFTLSNVLMFQAVNQWPLFKYLLKVVDAQQSASQINSELNYFKPKVIVGFPSTLEILAEEKVAGRLKIEPLMIVVSGENLRNNVRKKIEKAFVGCRVRNLYACTEGGTMAYECKCGHMHIHDDWIILEAVDKFNHPVKDGEVSDKVLMTCLYDYTQPKIRYEITDRVRIHHDKCPCGSKKPWIEVEGRLIDVLYFTQDDQKIAISPNVLPFGHIPGLSHYQFILHPGNQIELRLDVLESYDLENVFNEAARELKIILNQNGIFDYTLVLSDLKPQIDAKTGKFRQSYQVDL